jgi:hypothetical protein
VCLGLDVHDDVSKVKLSLEKRILYQVRDIVTLSNCAITGDAHVNVRESRKTALAHAALLDAGDTRLGFNRTKNFSDQFRSGLGVEDLVDGSSKHPHTVEDDQSTGKERRPRVSLRPSRSANQCRGDADGGGQ